MTSALLFLLVLAVAAWALRSARDQRPEGVPRALVRLAWLLALLHALLQAGRLPLPAGVFAGLALARGAAGLAVASQVAWLSLRGARTRAAWVRTAFAALAALVAALHAPWEASCLLAMPAVLSFGWRPALDTRQLFGTALGGIALLSFAAFARLPIGSEPGAAGAVADLTRLAKWANVLALTYVAVGVVKSLDAFVRDPSLGIRTVRRRLALSHALVVLVPILILASLWTMTTWLGVNSERALVAKRAIAAEADRMRGSLAQALGTPGDPGPALAAAGAAGRADWPGQRIWHVTSIGANRVWGEPLAGDSALVSWCERGDSLRRDGIVLLEGDRFLGAMARDPVRGGWAVALVPVAEALRGGPSSLSGALVWMPAHSSADDSTGDGADDVTLARPGARVDTSAGRSAGGRRRARAHFTANGEAVNVGDESGAVADSLDATGGAIVPGVQHHRGAWKNESFYVRARVPFLDAVAGMYRTVRENPFTVVPLAILAGLVLLTLPVTVFNFRLVRQLGRSFVQPVSALREGTRALGESRLDYRIDVRGDDELWDAAKAFNQMSEGLERAREVERARDRFEQELELARRIQQRLLPPGPPAIAGLEIAGASAPAREVGGDYYDHIPLGEDRVLLTIADVSGKGVPAALLMSAFRASLMSQDAGNEAPAEVATRLNAFLHRSVDPGKFVTAFVGFLDGRTGRFVYANAGHNPPALLRATGEVEWLATGGLILGIMADARFESGEATLRPGDLLVLYTDGVTEAADSAGEQLGEDRMIGMLRERLGLPCERIVAEMVGEVRRYEGEAGAADDVTLLAARLSFAHVSACASG